ncbi:MAG: PstS family phosphate ABC transporter substrate-binding protein [Candidatus Caldarchaeum sp.]
MNRKAVTTSTMAAIVASLVIGLVAGIFVGPAFTAPATFTTTVLQGTGATITRTLTTTVQVRVETTPLELSGKIEIDGSSTVYPITEAAATEFMKRHPKVSISVGISGTGGGFKRFVSGETDINDASRPITSAEHESAVKNGISWIEIPVAIDALVVVVNRQNDWVDCITISELKKIWEPNSQVRTWRDVRPEWPNQPIKLYGPGPDSGTFDYFTERVNEKTKASRTDFIASEDDNVLVAGVEAEKYALGYFGYAYYPEAQAKIRALQVRDDRAGGQCVEPNDQTASTFQYPLSRPLFIYVNKKSWDMKPFLREFVIYYVENGAKLAKKVSYTPFPDHYYAKATILIKNDIFDGLYELAFLKNKTAGPH